MPRAFSVLLTFVWDWFRSRLVMQLELMALRHQVAVYKQSISRPKLQPTDRLLWVWLSRVWPGWKEALEFVQPRTVLAWQKKRFRDDWRRLSQSGKPGRPATSKEVRERIRDMWRCRVGTARTFTAHAVRVSPSLSPNEACGRIGRQRVAQLSTFPTTLPQTARESFDLKPLSSDHLRVTSDDDQACFGVSHHAYLTVAGHRITYSPSPTLPHLTRSPGQWSTSQRHTLQSVCVRPLQPSNLGTTRIPGP